MHTRWFQFIHLQWKTTTIQCPNCSVHLKSTNCYSDCLWYCIVSIRKRKKNQNEKVTWKQFKPRYFFVWLLQCICEKFQQTNKYYFEMNVLSGMFFHAFHLPRNLKRKKKFKMIVCFVYKRLNNIKRNASTCVFFFIRLHLFTHLMIIVSFGSDLNLRIML